jgi:hypothetical protein
VFGFATIVPARNNGLRGTPDMVIYSSVRLRRCWLVSDNSGSIKLKSSPTIGMVPSNLSLKRDLRSGRSADDARSLCVSVLFGVCIDN